MFSVNSYRLLAHLYAAEALVLLDKIQEALQHLHPEHVKDISHELPTDGSGSSAEDATLKTSPPFSKYLVVDILLVLN